MDQLNAKRRRAELGDTLFDRLAEGGEPTLAALERAPEAGLNVLKAQTVRDVLRGALTFGGIRGRSRLLAHFYRENPNLHGKVDQIRKILSVRQWNQQFLPALEFRLGLATQTGNDFNTSALRKNIFNSAERLVGSILTQNDEDLEVHLADQVTTEALWKARMKILLPSLKLAQKGGRMRFPEGLDKDETLRIELARLNNVLGEMGVVVRRCGPHLKGQLATQRKLTEKIVCGELYKNDPDYAEKVMADFDKYTLSEDSFLISIDAGPLNSAGEILIAKTNDDPLTYTLEFLYVDEDYRGVYKLGTLAHNIARSLVSHIPDARLIATVYSANPNMPRHFKRDWVATGLVDGGKTLNLQIYEGQRSPTITHRAENHDEFVEFCEQYLNEGDYLLVGMEPDSRSQHIFSYRKPASPHLKPSRLFPSLVHFRKADT